jgi:hypothetical protein
MWQGFEGKSPETESYQKRPPLVQMVLCKNVGHWVILKEQDITMETEEEGTPG